MQPFSFRYRFSRWLSGHATGKGHSFWIGSGLIALEILIVLALLVSSIGGTIASNQATAIALDRQVTPTPTYTPTPLPEKCDYHDLDCFVAVAIRPSPVITSLFVLCGLFLGFMVAASVIKTFIYVVK